MIRQFDSTYAGHIDLENVGYAGTPVNDRRYPNEMLATRTAQGRNDRAGARPAGDTAHSGWQSTIFSPRAPNAFPTC